MPTFKEIPVEEIIEELLDEIDYVTKENTQLHTLCDAQMKQIKDLQNKVFELLIHQTLLEHEIFNKPNTTGG